MIVEVKIWNCQFFHYKQEQFEVKKKHTDRKQAGAMTTSCSSSYQITTVKNLVPLKMQAIFFKIFNDTDIHLCDTIIPAKRSVVNL